MVRIKATASLVTFSLIVVSIPPCIVTGCAAPIFVPCVIAAMCAANVINTPAEAACAPGGDTYITTGTGDSIISPTIMRVDFSKPPGVLRWITRHSAFSFFAFVIAR